MHPPSLSERVHVSAWWHQRRPEVLGPQSGLIGRGTELRSLARAVSAFNH